MLGMMQLGLAGRSPIVLLSVVASLFIGLNTPAETSQPEVPDSSSADWIRVTSKRSLANLESIDSFGITEQGTLAAKLLLEFLETQNLDSVRAAQQIYTRIIPKENFGGDYSALQWFSEYFLASPLQKQTLLTEPLVASYFQFFADNNFAALKEYLQRKYRLGIFSDQDSDKGRNRSAFLEDFILFNNPRRESWERTSKILDSLKIQPGTKIADIGSGPGYYSFQFAQRVGNTGQVFAIDTVKDHLDYIDRVSSRYNIQNIKTINNHNESLGLDKDQKVDIAFMCSLYHIIYIVYRESAREKFIENIKSALKQNGRFIIVDNSAVEDKDLPYHGPYLAKELIVAQLKHYGFNLESYEQFIPQRYVLTFRLN
jgi:ubiquinone/menaquinone biosynthesis C-methylase UbiE